MLTWFAILALGISLVLFGKWQERNILEPERERRRKHVLPAAKALAITGMAILVVGVLSSIILKLMESGGN